MLLSAHVNDNMNAKFLSHFDVDNQGTFVSLMIRFRPTCGLLLRMSAEIFAGPSESFYVRWETTEFY